MMNFIDGQFDIKKQLKKQDIVKFSRNNSGVITGLKDLDNNPYFADRSTWLDLRKFGGGADTTGTIDCSNSIVEALASAPRAAAYNDPRIPEGAVIYCPRGILRNDDAAIDLASGETTNHYSQGITLQGDGVASTILYTNSLKTLIMGNTSTERFTIRDMTIMSYAPYTGLGTEECLIDLLDCTYVKFENVRFYVRNPITGNTDCVLIKAENCYYSAMTNCHTYAHSTVSSENHNVTFAPNATKYGGTHMRLINNNAIEIRGHRWENTLLGVHAINEDGLLIHGGDIEQYQKGFLLDNCDFVRISVRFETHPEDLYQYAGKDNQYSVLCTETTKYCEIEGAGWLTRSDITHFGFIDKNGSNVFRLNNVVGSADSRTLIRNGDFALAGYIDTSFKIPSWSVVGAGTTVSNETSDLPPERPISRVMRITSTANVNGIKTIAFRLDPEATSRIIWKFWMKRVLGDHSLRLQLMHGADYCIPNMLTQGLTLALTDSKTGVPISGIPVWAANILTVKTALPNCFVEVNQKIALTGFTSTVSINASFLVTEVTSADTFKLAVNYDPGPITAVGTFARTGIDDIANLSKWQEFKGITTIRSYVVSWVDSGPNIVLTLKNSSFVPNVAGKQVKLFGWSNPNYNNVFTIVSTSGAAGTIVTIAKPAGPDPVDMSSGDVSLTGQPFFGWIGLYGDVNLAVGAEFTTGVNSTATHLVGGFVFKSLRGEMVISNDYLPGVEVLVGKKTYDWPDCIASGEQSTTVTVPGATVGDSVSIGLSVDNSSLARNGIVTSDDTVLVTIRNPTVSGINLPNCVITATVAHTY